LDVLGGEVTVKPELAAVAVALDEAKTLKRLEVLSQIYVTDVCDEELAIKMAGRLGVHVTLASNRVGRSYVRAFHAQGHAPLPHGQSSVALRRATEFFLRLLGARVASLRSALVPRFHVQLWSDAAGASRMVAAFFWHPVAGWLLTRWECLAGVLQDLLPREDEQIGYQELAGLVVALATLRGLCQGQLLTAWQDNQGVSHAVLSRGGVAPEINAVVGQVWLFVAVADVGLRLGRVPSAANVADGPTRDSLVWVERLAAVWVPPVVPGWLTRPWDHPLSAGLL